MRKRSFLKLPSAENALSRCLRASFFPVFVSLILFSCGGPQKIDIIEAKCGICHTTDRVYMQKRSKVQWDILLNGMKVRGLKLSPAEEKQVRDALYNKLGNGQ